MFRAKKSIKNLHISKKSTTFAAQRSKHFDFLHEICDIVVSMSELNKNKIGFLVALINEFGQRFGLSTADSYRYINKYGGVQMFLEHYDILHTLSFRDMVDGLAAYCKRQGGTLDKSN